MPLIRIVTSVDPPTMPSPALDQLLRDLSADLARQLGKPESYVMTCLDPRARMTFGGTFVPACFVEVMNVGALSPRVTESLSATITERIVAALGLPKNRIYIAFASAEPHMWGFDGATLA